MDIPPSSDRLPDRAFQVFLAAIKVEERQQASWKLQRSTTHTKAKDAARSPAAYSVLAETAWEGGLESDPTLTGHDEVGPLSMVIAITLVMLQLANLGSSETGRRPSRGLPALRWPRVAARDKVNKPVCCVFAAQQGGEARSITLHSNSGQSAANCFSQQPRARPSTHFHSPAACRKHESFRRRSETCDEACPSPPPAGS